MFQRAFGAREVDQAVGVGQGVQVVGDGDAGGLAQRGACVLAQGGRALAVQRDGQLQAYGPTARVLEANQKAKAAPPPAVPVSNPVTSLNMNYRLGVAGGEGKKA